MIQSLLLFYFVSCTFEVMRAVETLPNVTMSVFLFFRARCTHALGGDGCSPFVSRSRGDGCNGDTITGWLSRGIRGHCPLCPRAYLAR